VVYFVGVFRSTIQELSNGEYLIAFDDAGGVAFDFGVSAAK
jgi:hypothetical protein